MKEYHKIKTVFLRDPDTKYKTLLEGQYAIPEFEYLQHNVWVLTEKVDGTNICVMWDGNNITFGGKTEKAQIPVHLMNRLNEMFLSKVTDFRDIFDADAINVCLYGEGYGAKIEKGGGNYKADGQDFVLFDVRINEWWLQRSDVEDIAEKLGIGAVPIIGYTTLPEMVEKVRKGFMSRWGKFQAEGIVAKPAIELRARNGGRIITKLKWKDFERS